MTNKEYADSLRMIADFYEQHTELPLPHGHEKFKEFGTDVILRLARILKKWRKEFDADFDGSVALVTKFGEIEFRAIGSKNSYCKRKQVGVRQVPEKVIPQMVIPAHKEPIYEWDCSESLLEKEAK